MKAIISSNNKRKLAICRSNEKQNLKIAYQLFSVIHIEEKQFNKPN